MILVILLGSIASGCQAIASLVPLDNTPVVPLFEHHPEHVTIARVTRVVNGHTIEVQPTSSTSTLNQTIRLIGIQAPAQGQDPWGPEAQTYLEDLLLGNTVQLSIDQKTNNLDRLDSYGRQWAYVWLKDKLVNQMLIADGKVLEDERSPHLDYAQQFSHAQHRARILGIGIWHPDHPIRQTPHEFWQQQN